MLNSSSKIVFYYLIQKKPFYVAILFVLNLISTACNLIGTILLIPIFSLLVGSQEIFSDRSRLKIIGDLLIQESSETKLFIFVMGLAIAIAIKNIADYSSKIIGFKQIKDIAYELKIRGLELLCRVDFDYYRKNKPSEILTKLNREVDKAALAIKSVREIGTISAIVAIVTGLLLITSWQLTLVSFAILGSTFWLGSWLKFQVAKSRNASVESHKSSNRQLFEFLSAIRPIKTMANELEVSKAIASSIAEKHQRQLRTQSISATFKPITELGGMLTILALAIVAYSTHERTTSAANSLLLIYLAILFRLLPFIDRLGYARVQYINTRSSLEVVASFLNSDKKLVTSFKNLSSLEAAPKIEFRAVSFAYPNHAQIILDKIGFSIEAGKALSLIGLTPISNSPICDLLTRFYPAIGGKILLDDREIADYESRNLRKAIAVIGRDTFIFNCSLADNIAYGLDNVTQEDIVAATKKAQIYRFINQLPAGFSTIVGEKDGVLSPLQRLQIGFARAFLRNPKIIILDEPLALLKSHDFDFKSVRQIVHSLTRNCTTIIITQQLDLAKMAEQIVLFEGGKAIATGTHQQLLQQGNTYQRLCSMQFKANQQSRQVNLAQKIARKLARQNDCLSTEIRLNLNTLIEHLDSLNKGLLEDEEDIILDESFQSAKDMLKSLKAYEDKISRGQID